MVEKRTGIHGRIFDGILASKCNLYKWNILGSIHLLFAKIFFAYNSVVNYSYVSGCKGGKNDYRMDCIFIIEETQGA